MLKLGGKVIEIKLNQKNANLIIAVSTDPNIPEVLRSSKAFFVNDQIIPSGFRHYLFLERNSFNSNQLTKGQSYTILPDDYSYINNNDIIRLSPNGNHIRVLFRASSKHNTILLTEQCNHYCLMCSQPPKEVDDSWILDDVEKTIKLIPKDTLEIGFTGGEPTLNKERFLNILKLTKSYLPQTAIHILSNGRSFADINFAKNYASIQHNDMMVGIPIYSDDPSLHDYIVQADGAFDQTILGILNLKKLGQKVEIRIVIHKLNISRLKKLCEFITRNLLFVDHVALMGLELMGFARANIDELWIDPYDYKNQLSDAAKILDSFGITISIFNHQLCLLNDDVKKFYVKSISDWKNEYASECEGCLKKHECGGFFASGIKYKYSSNLKPFK